MQSKERSTLAQKIKIKYNSESLNVFVMDGKLKKSILKEYFPGGGTLTYEIDNETYLLNANDQFIFIEPDINEYNLKITKDDSKLELGTKKRKRVQEILDSLHKKKNGSAELVEQKDPDLKLKNKKQEEIKANDNSKKEVKACFNKRVIYVQWKHRNNDNSEYEFLGSVIGPEVKIDLDGNKNYPIDELKSIFIEKYVTDKNKFYFSNAQTKIGTADGSVIDNYVHENMECTLWDYVRYKGFRKPNHSLKLYILTTKVIESVKSVDIEKYPSCSSLKIDHRSLNNKEETFASSLEVPIIVKETTENEKILKDKSNDNFKIPTFVKEVVFEKQKMEGIQVDVNDKSNDQFMQKSLFKKNNIESSYLVKQSKENIVTHSCETLVVKKKEKPNNFTSESEMGPSGSASVSHHLTRSIRLVEEKDLEFSNTVLGRGAQGIVIKGQYLGSEVAIKSMQRGKSDKLIIREILLLEKVRHPQIIYIMAACSTLTQIHIVMEYFKSNSLFDVLFNPTIRRKYFMFSKEKNNIVEQLACALTYLHLQLPPIIHRDVKAGNILVNRSFQIKLCDLGLGKCKSIDKTLQSTRVDTMRGTYLYMAPEILLKSIEATPKCDVWSFACTVVELYNEQPVWDVENHFSGWDCAKTHLHSKHVPSMDKVPIHLKEKLNECFNYNPTERLAMHEFLKFLQEAKYNPNI